jgi:hypothetical protein
MRYLDTPKAILIGSLIIAFGLTLSGRYTSIPGINGTSVLRTDGLTGAVAVCGTVTLDGVSRNGCFPLTTATIRP